MRNLKKVLSVLLVVVMLATAMVPAFAAETFNYSTQAKTLYDLGLFKGTSATEYVPDLGAALTREQGFALIVRLLGKAEDAAALKAADVDSALSPFGDAKDIEPTLKNTIAYAVKNGLVIGDTSKLLNAKGPMLGNDFATVLLRKLGYEVTADGYKTATATLADKGGLSTSEASKFGSKELIRDDAVGMMFASLQAKYKTGETVIAKLVADKAVDEAKAVAGGVWTKPAAAAVTAKVTGVKQFTLTFNTPAEKVKASSIKVAKGANGYTVDGFKLAADKKSATFTITSSVVAGEYVISVSDISDKAIDAKVTAENERIDKIEFPSENAVLALQNAYKKLNINYRILNQYGEDVTSKKYSLVTFQPGKGQFESDSKNKDGVLVLTSDSDFIVNEKVAVSATYVDTDNARTVFASTVLTVSQMAQVGEISITKLYNGSDEKLKTDSIFNDFKLIVDAKDQYGNKIPAVSLADALVMQSTDVSLLKIASKFEEITVNGEKVTALSLENGTSNDAPTFAQRAGTANVMLVSKFNGKIAQFAVTVNDTQKIDTLVIQTPDYPVAGEMVTIPFTATDKDGNEINKLSGLWLKGNGTDTHYLTVTGGVASCYFENDPVSGKPVLTLDARALSDKTTLYITGTTNTYKFVNYTINLQKPATLESVSGFSSSAYQNVLLGDNSTDYKFDNILVKDSYGRDVTKDKLYTTFKLGQAVPGGYKFTIASSDTSKVNIGSTTPTVSNAVYDIGTSASTVYALDKGSSSMTLTLMKWDTTKSPAVWTAIDDVTFSVNVVKQEDIVSYAHTAITSIYARSDAYGESFIDKTVASGKYASGTNGQEIKVEGVLANGKKVLMPQTLYTVYTTGDISFDRLYNPSTLVTPAKGKIYSDAILTNDSGDDTTGTYTISIPGTKNLATQNLTYSVKVSGVVPTAASMGLVATTDKYKTSGYTSFKNEGATVASMTYAQLVNKGGIDGIDGVSIADINTVVPNILKFKDQYGTTMTAGYLSGTFVDGNGTVVTGVDAGSRPADYTQYIQSIRVTDVKNTNNEIVNETTFFAGYSVYVTVVTNDGKVFGFTLAIK